MRLKKTPIDGLLVVYPTLLHDERGLFFEAYQYKKLKELGIKDHFVQDNQSFSSKGVLRGIHLQKPPSQQAKLIRVIKGSVLDVAVDLRKDSPTFGQHYKTILDDKEHKMFYIPEGFGHGFLALEDTILLYKCNDYYDKPTESGILWNDPELNIDWSAPGWSAEEPNPGNQRTEIPHIAQPLLSEKDLQLPTFKEFAQSL